MKSGRFGKLDGPIAIALVGGYLLLALPILLPLHLAAFLLRKLDSQSLWLPRLGRAHKFVWFLPLKLLASRWGQDRRRVVRSGTSSLEALHWH
jgi:hypothetical protein